MSLTTRFLIGVALGGVVGVVLLYIAASAAFGDPQNFRIAQNLFPYALATKPAILEAPWLVLALSFLQYPLYGSALAFGFTRKRHRVLFVFAIATLILGTHLFTVRIAHAKSAAASRHVIIVDYSSE